MVSKKIVPAEKNLNIVKQEYSGYHKQSTISEDASIDITDSFNPLQSRPAVDVRKAARTILEGRAQDKIEEAWRYETGDLISTTPALNSEGILFIGNCAGTVFAIDGRTGEKRWENRVAKELSPSQPAIGPDGKIYVISADNRIIALDEKTGEKKWEKKLGRRHCGDLYFCATSQKGELFLVTSKMVITLDEKTHRELWRKETDSVTGLLSHTVGPDGNLIVGSEFSRLAALDRETGREIWNYQVKALITDSPVVASGGTVYISDMSGTVYAINGRTGKEQWRSETKSQGPATVSLGPQDTLYMMSNFRRLYVFDGQTGQKKWDKFIEETESNSPLVDQNGTIYFISRDSMLRALEGTSGDTILAQKIEFRPSSEPVIFSGMFIQGDRDGIIIALREKKEPFKDVIRNTSGIEDDKKNLVRDIGEGFVEIAGIRLPVRK